MKKLIGGRVPVAGAVALTSLVSFGRAGPGREAAPAAPPEADSGQGARAAYREAIGREGGGR